MHEIISFLRNAVERDANISIRGCYVFGPGGVHARNVSLQAGVATESGYSFNLPAEALDVALARMKDIQSVAVEDDAVIIRAGRLKSTIRRILDEPAGVPPMPEEWESSPPSLPWALGLCLPFLGEQGVTTCVRLADGRATAISQTRSVDVPVDGLLVRSGLLTREVCEFLVAQGAPDELACDENSIAFRWEDGRWMRAQLYNAKFPEESVDTIYRNAGTEAPIVIDEAFREAYADAAALSTTGVVKLTAAGFHTKSDASMCSVDHQIDVPEEHESYWDAKVLEPVVAHATAFNPAAAMSGALFVGEGFRGVVMGRRVW